MMDTTSTTTTLTADEAARMRVAARERHLAVSAELESTAATVARIALRNGHRFGNESAGRTIEVLGDQIIILRSAAREALADWQDARELCGLTRSVVA